MISLLRGVLEYSLESRIIFSCWALRLIGIWGFPKIRVTFLGVPIIRIIVFSGLYWGSLVLGNYHIILLVQPTLICVGLTVPDCRALDLG